MSTRSNIAILLREEDRNRDFETPMGTIVNPHGAKYLYVYCHNDGYPSGVGADLKDMFEGEESYEEALEYILAGDRSTTDLTYWDWRRETDVDPAAANDEEDMYQNDYLYIIEEVDGSHRIHVRQYGEDELPTNDDIREAVEDWYNQNITEEDIKDPDNYEISDMMYDCLYDIAYEADETQEGDDLRDIICETLESLLERDRELAEDEEDEEEEESKTSETSDEVYQVNSHGDMVGPKQMTVNSHGDIVYTDAPDWR